MLPALQGDGDGLLPAGVHKASIADLRSRFGSKAVKIGGQRRDMIIDALDVYVRMVRVEFLKPTIWVNGGLVTGKTWEAPDDADVVVFINPSQAGADLKERIKLLSTGSADHLSIGPHSLDKVKIKPMGGLIDGYIMADTHPARRYWNNLFSSVRLPDESISDTLSKGFVEVT
ncbi:MULTISPECIES: DUF6932 family protein [unclassified Mycolicibacterium]|uniref:DUF6932 family protein n=1 Tax=unclassified Mycolicibacterium TaxID=2636767 RepID=UPI002ED8BE6B